MVLQHTKDIDVVKERMGGEIRSLKNDLVAVRTQQAANKVDIEARCDKHTHTIHALNTKQAEIDALKQSLFFIPLQSISKRLPCKQMIYRY